MTAPTDELAAMHGVWDALAGLDPGARSRVLDWVQEQVEVQRRRDVADTLDRLTASTHADLSPSERRAIRYVAATVRP